MKSWEAAWGSVIIGRPHEGLGEPMSPLMAANFVDQWFPSTSQRALWTLQEIATALGEKFHPSGNDDRELREILKRALYAGKLIAVERAQHRPEYASANERPQPAPVYHREALGDEKLSLRFRLVVRDTFEAIVGAKVLIEFEDGHREEQTTNSAGEAFFLTPHRQRFKVLKVDEPFRLAKVMNG